MLTKRFSIIIFAVVCLMSLANDAFACACCSDAGTYSIRASKPSAYELGILEEMKFDEAANLYMTEAGYETLKGLESVQTGYESSGSAPDFFGVTNIFAAKKWKLNFKTKDGKTGTLVLPMPARMLKFEVDIHDGSDQGLGPSLYKEWRFKGAVQSGNGFFQKGIVRPTAYFLVLQGRGRGCDDVLTFTNWRLEITGRKADYAFFGKLSSGSQEETETEKQ